MNKVKKHMLHRFVGFLGERDEYQEKIIYEVLGNANMLTFALLTIGTLVSFIWDSVHGTISLGTILLLLIQQFNSFYIVLKMKKYKVDQTEFYTQESLDKAIRKVKIKSVWAGIDWGIWMFVWLHIVFPVLWKEPINISWFDGITMIMISGWFGGCMYALARSKFKLVKED